MTSIVPSLSQPLSSQSPLPSQQYADWYERWINEHQLFTKVQWDEFMQHQRPSPSSHRLSSELLCTTDAADQCTQREIQRRSNNYVLSVVSQLCHTVLYSPVLMTTASARTCTQRACSTDARILITQHSRGMPCCFTRELQGNVQVQFTNGMHTSVAYVCQPMLATLLTTLTWLGNLRQYALHVIEQQEPFITSVWLHLQTERAAMFLRAVLQYLKQ